MSKLFFQVLSSRRLITVKNVRRFTLASSPASSTQGDTIIIKSEGSESPQDSMTAWQINSFGGIEKLELAVVKAPIIKKPTDVLVKIKAASVNPLDVAMLGGYGQVVLDTLRQIDGYMEEKLSYPLILGRDFCGEVVAKGNKVRPDIMIGDIVYGVIPPHMPGCHAQQAIADEAMICRKPDFMGVNEAATILYTGMTAWSALKITGDLFLLPSKNKRILVIGASGGVGTAAVQLLKAWGAEVVATCQSDAKVMVENLKADAVIDYTMKEAMQYIKESGKYDIILDASGQANPSTYIPFLKDWSNSKFITLRSPVLKNTDLHGLMFGMVRNVADILLSNVTSGAPTKGSTVRWGFFMPVPAGIKEISDLVAGKKFTPVIQDVFPYEELPAAYKKMSDGHVRGKIVVSVSGRNN